jgi:hypothetical protein
MGMKCDIVVVGGGAAGFFGAINVALLNPNKTIVILEKTNKVLSKVKISGGGRCNVTNSSSKIGELIKNYPRGQNELKKIFYKFNTTDTVKWFSELGVALKTEADGRIFPISNQSQTIIDLFLQLCEKYKIRIITGAAVEKIVPSIDKFEIITAQQTTITCKKVLIACGGFQKEEAYGFITSLGIQIKKPVPSLFTFNLPNHPLNQLAGISIKNISSKIVGQSFVSNGDILITHWGFSGPAILKLSAFAALYLYEKNYQFKFSISWLGTSNYELVAQLINQLALKNPKGRVINFNPKQLPERLWHYLVTEEAKISKEKRWNELAKKERNKLIEILSNQVFEVKGKTTFKEEFVTAGGVELNEIDLNTMESKKVKNFYFAGEILNIDGITGGFNFQNAWSTAFIAAKHLAI